MSNNKDFKIKNGIQPTVYHEAVGTVSVAGGVATLDLSTGSVFDYTPTSDVQVTLTNPAASGTSSGATLLLGSEDSAGVSSVFSTTLYTGTGATQTIDNGIDLAGDGGLVWTKSRNGPYNNMLFDSERGGYWLGTNLTSASTSISPNWTLNSNGYTLSTVDANWNNASYNYVSWTFKKQTKFFDVLTYTGNGVAGRTISHDLGAVPGFMVIKKTSGTGVWYARHRHDYDDYYRLNATDAASSYANLWASYDPTDVDFKVGTTDLNNNGNTYVAYLFAHDTDASSIIKCGSYTGNGSSDGPEINLGWEPQWFMWKRTDATANWIIIDNMRGISDSDPGDPGLFPNLASAENPDNSFNLTATGLKCQTNNSDINASGGTYIYMAIRSPSIPTITYDPNLQWPSGTAPTAPATGETDVITFNTTDGGTTYQAVQVIDGAK